MMLNRTDILEGNSEYRRSAFAPESILIPVPQVPAMAVF